MRMTNDAHQIAYGIIDDIGQGLDIEEYLAKRPRIEKMVDSDILRYIDLNYEYCPIHDDDLNECNARELTECWQMQYDAYLITTDNDIPKIVEAIIALTNPEND